MTVNILNQLSQLTLQAPLSLPILMLLSLALSVAAIILSVVSLLVSLTTRRRLAAAAQVKEAETRAEATPVKEIEIIPEVQPTAVSQPAVEPLQSLAKTLNLQSILFFNLAGLPIDHYNVKDENTVAASLAEFLHMLRRFGFPTDVINLRNGGNQAYIMMVDKLGDVEVYALTVGRAEGAAHEEEVKTLLRQALSMIIGRGES